MKRRVMIAWHDGRYHVAFVDPPLEFSGSTTVDEDAVLRVVRDYLGRLDEA